MLGSPGVSHLNIKSFLEALSSKAMETVVATRRASLPVAHHLRHGDAESLPAPPLHRQRADLADEIGRGVVVLCRLPRPRISGNPPCSQPILGLRHVATQEPVVLQGSLQRYAHGLVWHEPRRLSEPVRVRVHVEPDVLGLQRPITHAVVTEPSWSLRGRTRLRSAIEARQSCEAQQTHPRARAPPCHAGRSANQTMRRREPVGAMRDPYVAVHAAPCK